MTENADSLKDREISYDDAVKLLREGKSIHTFRNPRENILVGADWSREHILKALKKAPVIYLSGPGATSLNHGLAIEDDTSYLFIETKKI